MRKHAMIAALAALLFLSSTGCSVDQLKAWYTSRGVDTSQFTQQELEQGSIIATAYWEAVRNTPPPPPPVVEPQRPYLGPFLECVRYRESRGRYDAYNSSSGASGAFQFLQTTWNNTAAHAGRWDLVGRSPRTPYVSELDQDLMAIHLLNWIGTSPWAASAPHNC